MRSKAAGITDEDGGGHLAAGLAEHFGLGGICDGEGDGGAEVGGGTFAGVVGERIAGDELDGDGDNEGRRRRSAGCGRCVGGGAERGSWLRQHPRGWLGGGDWLYETT